MVATLPSPDVPALGVDNAIDLEQLANDDLLTWVHFLGIAVGAKFWPTWFACTATGDAADYFNDLVEVGPDDLTPQGMAVHITNAILMSLDQGWVFYSFKMYDPSAPDGRGEESMRRFFYVGKRPQHLQQLPVMHLKQSHELCVHPDLIDDGGGTLVALPYRAMRVGDKVTAVVDLYFDDGSHFETWSSTYTLEKPDIDKPLKWSIEKGKFEFIEGGFAHMNYRIDYVGTTLSSESVIQTVRVIAPPDTLLPAPGIEDFQGGELDPDVYLDGIYVNFPAYPEIKAGDGNVLHATGAAPTVRTLRVDPSSVDSGMLRIHVDHAWLATHNGSDVSFRYQYAREGCAGSSEPLELALRKPLDLPMPIVVDATPDGDGKGFLLAESILSGVYVRLPDELDLGSAGVQMHWAGHGATGNYIADPMLGEKAKFYIPPAAVPANMGKRLKVFYKVSPPGKDSEVFDLEIKDMKEGWPTLLVTEPQSSGNRISLAKATNGVTFTLASWSYMAMGQRVQMQVQGLLADGGSETFPLRTETAEVVTEDEYYDGKLKAVLPREFLERLKLNQQFNVSVSTSFDEGITYKTFPHIYPILIA